MLRSMSKLPSIILFCLDNLREKLFFEDVGFDFFFLVAIKLFSS